MRKVELSNSVSFGDNFNVKTWDDAVVRWLFEKAHKASLESDQCILRWLNPQLSGMILTDIDRKVVDALTLSKIESGASNATVNRMLALVRAILRRASMDWEWLETFPKIRLLREPVRRVRFLSADEARRLLHELPVDLAEMAAFSLATGLRKSNVTGLLWSQVDMGRGLAWIHPDQSKSRKAIAIPLGSDAMKVLALRKGRHSSLVFGVHGKTSVEVNNSAWKKALKRALIEDFRWHDLRHTWASWHAQNGTPLAVLQELGGWESQEMVRRYAHFSVGHLTEHVVRLPTFL